MLVTSMSKVNYILLFQAYSLLHSVSKYELIYRIRSMILNNARLKWDNDLITLTYNKFSRI